MNTLSYKVAVLIKRTSPEQTASIEVMQYALTIILNSLLIIAVSLIIGGLTGKFPETALTLLSFSLLRLFSGGKHLKTATQCNLFSISLCSFVPHLALFGSDYLLVINMISLTIMVFYSPSPDINAQIPNHWYPGLKLISILVVALNFLIQSPVIGLAFLAQSLTINLFQRGRNT